MEPITIVLVSDDPTDKAFFKKVCDEISFKLAVYHDWSKTAKKAVAPTSILVWRLNDDLPEETVSERMLQVPAHFVNLFSPQRCFILSDRPIFHRREYLDQAPHLNLLFRHNIIRRYADPAVKICAKVMLASEPHKLSGLDPYFSSKVKSEKVILRSSGQRSEVVELVHGFLKKNELDSQLAARVEHATDELILNAIFDAAWNESSGMLNRPQFDRDAKFELPKGEKVLFEMKLGERYGGICVTDFYGSLNRERVLSFLGQNFVTQDYRPVAGMPGAGLGLYGILRSGLCLVLSCWIESRTDAVILFPRCTSYRDFKKAFQCVAYFETSRERLRNG